MVKHESSLWERIFDQFGAQILVLRCFDKENKNGIHLEHLHFDSDTRVLL